jgi:hypothetical protein
VEIIRFSLLGSSQPDGTLAWFRSPRICHFTETIGGVRGAWQVSIHDRVTIPRRLLLDHQPSRQKVLPPETVRRIASWVARRYTRAAFPDEFNRRCLPAQKRLKGRLKSEGYFLTAIFLVVQDEELDENSCYEVVVIGCMREDTFQAPETRAKAQALVDAIESALDECMGIEVRESSVRSEASITLDDLRMLKRWDFDYLSLRDESVADLPRAD